MHLAWQADVRSEGRGGGWDGGGAFMYLLRIPCLAPLVCLCHRDDAPSPLLLGILATRDPKEDEEEEKWEESKK